ncbi:Hypothetical protein KVN_LOCUS47 [uncultured virus]|nr:Hypothetical protein KVN_LOCUS47 [uncultured virus]
MSHWFCFDQFENDTGFSDYCAVMNHITKNNNNFDDMFEALYKLIPYDDNLKKCITFAIIKCELVKLCSIYIMNETEILNKINLYEKNYQSFKNILLKEIQKNTTEMYEKLSIEQDGFIFGLLHCMMNDDKIIEITDIFDEPNSFIDICLTQKGLDQINQ